MSWSTFPTEIQLKVIASLDRDGCKSLRLTNKSNANLTEQKLFYTIHLTPNTRSFERARNIAISSHLSQHVHALVYHIGILDDIHDGFATFRDDIIRLHHPSGSYDDIIKDILWKYHCFLEEMEGQDDFATRDESEELKSLFQQFDSLESITTIWDEDDPFTPPQDCVGRRTGLQSSRLADGPHLSNLFNAMVGKRLTTIYGWCSSWRCLPRITEIGLDQVEMKSMNTLALGLFNSEFLDYEEEDRTAMLEALDAFLAKTATSERYNLLIDFDEIPFESATDELLPISKVLFKHQWPSLKRLELQGLVTTISEMTHFLEKHSASLNQLHLDDIELGDEVEQDPEGNTATTPGSIILLFHWISENLHLTSASISGCFTNGYNESWFVNLDHEDETCLRRDIELWLSRKAPPPLPRELLYAEQKTKEEITAEIQSQDGPINCGIEKMIPYPGEEWTDGSWVWDISFS